MRAGVIVGLGRNTLLSKDSWRLAEARSDMASIARRLREQETCFAEAFVPQLWARGVICAAFGVIEGKAGEFTPP